MDSAQYAQASGADRAPGYIDELRSVTDNIMEKVSLLEDRLITVSVRRDTPDMAAPEAAPDNALHSVIIDLNRARRRLNAVLENLGL